MSLYVPNIGDEAFCVSKEDGIYSDPSDDAAFYICEGEKPQKKFCPNGLKFNPLISSCDVPVDVNFIGHVDDSVKQVKSEPISDHPYDVISEDNIRNDASVKGNETTNGNSIQKLLSIKILKGTENASISDIKTAEDNNEHFSHSGMAQETIQEHRYQRSNQSHTDGETGNNAQQLVLVSSRWGPEKGRVRKVPIQEYSGLIYSGSRSKEEGMQATVNYQKNNTNHIERGGNYGKNLFYIASRKQNPPSGKASLIQINPNMPNTHIIPHTRNDTRISSSPKRKPVARHHELFVINIYGEHPNTKDLENWEQTGDNKDKNSMSNLVIEASGLESKDSTMATDPKIPTSAIDVQGIESVMLNTPGVKPEYEFEQNNPYGTLDATLVNESIPKPVHFKVHINTRDTVKEPVTNCNIYDCSEKQTRLENERLVSINERPASKIANDSPASLDQPNHILDTFKKEGANFARLHFKTLGSKNTSAKEVNGGMIMYEVSETRPQMAETSQSKIIEHGLENTNTTRFPEHQLHSLTKEQKKAIQGYQMNPAAAYDNKEKDGKKKAQDVTNASGTGNNVGSELGKEMQMKRNAEEEHKTSFEETKMNKSYGGKECSFLSKHEPCQNEISLENVRAPDNNKLGVKLAKILEQRNNLHSEFLPGKVSFNKRPDNLEHSESNNITFSTSTKGDQHRSDESVLVSKDQTTQPQEQQQRQEQKQRSLPFRLEHSAGFASRLSPKNPELYQERHRGLQYSSDLRQKKQSHISEWVSSKLNTIVKRLGTLASFSNANSSYVTPLGKRSYSKGHMLQILRSLIDRPLKVGSKNKEVASILKSVMKNPIQRNMPRVVESQQDSQSFKESGDIAQSILEANKEFMDDVVMQGMLFSDEDPEATNIPSMVNSLSRQWPTNSVTVYSDHEQGAHKVHLQRMHQSVSTTVSAINTNHKVKATSLAKLKSSPVHLLHQPDWGTLNGSHHRLKTMEVS